MVPMDQPANALAMVNAFVHGGKGKEGSRAGFGDGL